MQIKIIAVGKMKESFLQEGMSEYLKRLSPYCQIECIEVKEAITQDTKKNLKEEKDAILKHIKKNDYIVTLEIEGKIRDSETFSQWLCTFNTYDHKTITFIIGGSDGLDDDIKHLCQDTLSLGKMTFPHQWARLMLFEQIYRAMMIHHQTKYHK